MATVYFQKGYSLRAPQDWDYTVTEHTATTLTIAGGVNELSFGGEFLYSGDNVYGEISEATYTKRGEVAYTISDLDLDAHTMQRYIEGVDPQLMYAYVFAGDDTMYGTSGAQVILGYDGNDHLYGQGGMDQLFGGGDDDYLNGGAGADSLQGGLGDDTFAFNSRGGDVDTIKDFGGGDSIELWSGAGVPFKNLGNYGTLNADFFQANAGGNAVDGDDYILYDTTTGELSYDADGSGAGAKVVFAVVGVSSHPALTHDDFMVIAV